MSTWTNVLDRLLGRERVTELMRQRAREDMDRIVREQHELEELLAEIKRRTAELTVLTEEVRLVRSTGPTPIRQWTPVGIAGDWRT